MPQVINTNISWLNAQRNLNASQNALAVSLRRLSSGLRINSAKDDAAGLAISQRFTAQINGLNQSTRNASDGISLAQTAQGALGEITNNLATYPRADRAIAQRDEQRDRPRRAADRSRTTARRDPARRRLDLLQRRQADRRLVHQRRVAGGRERWRDDRGLAPRRHQVAQLGTSTIAQVTGAAATAFTAITAGDLTINSTSVGAIAVDTNAANRATRIAAAVNAVSATTNVIDEGLKGCLDPAGGEIAAQLSQLYDYMCRRLLLASLKNERAGLDEVSQLLDELRGAWAKIDPLDASATVPTDPLRLAPV